MIKKLGIRFLAIFGVMLCCSSATAAEIVLYCLAARPGTNYWATVRFNPASLGRAHQITVDREVHDGEFETMTLPAEGRVSERSVDLHFARGFLIDLAEPGQFQAHLKIQRWSSVKLTATCWVR
jgi:hypothetical protein